MQKPGFFRWTLKFLFVVCLLNTSAVFAAEAGDESTNTPSAMPAVPNMISADPPPYPVLFLHGLYGSSNGSFGDTTQFLENDLNWTPGGNLRFNGSSLTVNPENFDANGDFYTLDFGNNSGTYPDGRGLIHQSDELAAAIDYLATNGVSPIMVMGHSNGGLVARYYLANTPQADTKIKKYISYGSPHRGADLSFFGGPTTHGVRDTFYDCSPADEVVYQGKNFFLEDVDNQFLTNLSQDPLPTLDDGYITLIGNERGRSPDCHDTDIWDGVVAKTSQDLREIDLPPADIHAILTDHVHVGQGEHISAVLCALENAKCANFSVSYPGSDPVTLQVTSPTSQVVREAGNSLPELIEIPAAELMKVPGAGSIEMDIAMVPLAESGEYSIQLTAAAGASPTDTFSLVVNVGGTETVLAQDMEVQDIPAGGFTVQIPFPSSLTHSDFNGDAMSDVLAVHNSGALAAGLLENSVLTQFDFLLTADPAQGWTINATGDFNGDKRSDLFLYNTITGEYRVVLLNGIGIISDTVLFDLDPLIGLEPRGVGDFDGDGEAEIILYHPPSGFTAFVYLTGGAVSSIEEATVIDEANNWTLKDTGDFNQDAKTDLLITNTVTGETAVIEMNGSVPTGPTTILVLDPSTGWTVEGNGDFTGNGQTDVLILHTSGTLGVLVMDELTLQSFYVPGGLSPDWEIVNVGNYDDTNKADLLVFDTTTENLITVIQDGATIIASNPVLNLGPEWTFSSGKASP